MSIKIQCQKCNKHSSMQALSNQTRCPACQHDLWDSHPGQISSEESDIVWYFSSSGERGGPVSAVELRRLTRFGWVADDENIWRDGLADWVPMAQLSTLVPESSNAAASIGAAPQPIRTAPPLPQNAPGQDGMRVAMIAIFAAVAISIVGVLAITAVSVFRGVTDKQPASADVVENVFNQFHELSERALAVI